MTEWPARLVLIGAGKMGGAMAQGWLGVGLPASSLTILEPNPSSETASLAADRGIALNPGVAVPPPEMLVLAVKPQTLDQVAPQIASLAGERTLLLSIIAGKTIANLRARLPTPAPSCARCRIRRLRSAGASPPPSPTETSTRSNSAGASNCLAQSGRSIGSMTKAGSTR